MLEGKKIEIRTGGDFDPVPMDRYTVMATDVNLVQQFNQFNGKDEDVLNYQFTILDDKPMPMSDGSEESTRGRYLWKRCRPALNARSWLGKLAKAAMGRDLTKEEIDAFDPESIIGVQVDVMVEQAESKDGQKVFNNIVSFAKTAKKLEPVEQTEKSVGKKTVEKTTTAAVAPQADDPEEFMGKLDAEKAKAEPANAETAEEDDPEVLELQLKLAKAKAKKAAEAKK